MTVFLFSFLTILDVTALLAAFQLFRKWKLHESILAEVTQERKLIQRSLSETQQEVQKSVEKNQALYEKIIHIAATVEKEVATSSEVIASNIESVMKSLGAKFEAPLQELRETQNALDTYYRKLEQMKDRTDKIVVRGEQICRFIDKQFTYEEMQQEMEENKYQNIRHLLTKGVSVSTIADELHVSPQEVSLVKELL